MQSTVRNTAVRIKAINPGRADVARLINQSDALMQSMYPPQSNHLDDIHELKKANVCFVGAFVDQSLAGTAAVKVHKNDGIYGEVKRVFVDEAYRGQNLGRQLMAYLEAYLEQRGILICRLETGIKQTAALELYRKMGYSVRGPYGAYQPDPLSVFMEKRLKPDIS